MDYSEALRYIHSVSWLGSRPGLSRTRELLSRMGNPQDSLRFVHVAGTNGKGSFCAMLASVLKEAGCKTGLYTSPYVLRFNERFQINGAEIPDGELAEITGFVRSFADRMEEQPTEFELITAIGFEYFRRSRCDVVVLEVGMGGELDSTNVIKAPLLAVITDIALDHTKVLGPTLADIARAKAGIIKEGCTVLSSDNTAEGAAVVAKLCAERGCPHFSPDCAALTDKSCTADGISFSYKGDSFRVPLCGTYQFRNAALVLKATELLKSGAPRLDHGFGHGFGHGFDCGFDLGTEAVKKGLAGAVWHARFEFLSRDPVFVYDGAHNPQGIEAAAESCKAVFGDVPPVILLGVMADKDYKSEIATLLSLGGSFVTVTPANPRALPAPALAAETTRLGGDCVAAETVPQGVEAALRKAAGKRPVLATGTLYMYGEVRAALEKLLR